MSISSFDTLDSRTEQQEEQRSDNHSNIVAAHYNRLEEKGLSQRFNSPIFYLRNFNNWIKSVLIQVYIDKARNKDYGRPLRVLDICCGKGGDQVKWEKARVDHVVFADIAETSVQQCRSRYEDLRKRRGRIYSAEFIAADCTKDTLRDKYKDASINFDIVSCQFGLHYSFESFTQARRMLGNISECLRAGGYFIGTIPNAHEIVARCQKSSNNVFGNRIFNIKLLFDPKENAYPIFGATYDFNLEGVVACPEFLVHFDSFVKLALEFGLELEYKATFEDFFNVHRDEYKTLLNRIKCFESYPPSPGQKLIGDESEYEHAKEFIQNCETRKYNKLGTMTASEWEVATIYMVFAFKKLKSTLDENGRPVYNLNKNS